MANMDELKKMAGIKAADLIQNGMTVGLGTGSTAAYMIDRLGERLQKENLSITAVSTSWSTTLQCRRLGIPLKEIDEVSKLDMVIDGADEIDSQKNLIKGRGAAHLLEKIVASMTSQYIIIADNTKKVATLGEKMPVPVEVLPKAISIVTAQIEALGGKCTIRLGSPGKDGPIISDSGNLIVDAKFTSIPNPQALDAALNAIPGLLGHGLFIGMATRVILATPKGLEEF